MAVANLDDPSALAHLIAGALRIKTEEKQELLEEVDVAKRLRRLSEILARELEVVAIGSRIQSQVQSEIDKSQREYVLRQQLKAIQEELGERDPAEAEVEELREQLAERSTCPRTCARQADRELSRLEKLPQAAAEHGVIRTYLEWIASLPWGKRDRGQPRPRARARGARRRPLRHREGQGPHPRVPRRAASSSRTRAARSSASSARRASARRRSAARSPRALERKFERIRVGGMRDEAEIRGHRRTYIGAMPGTIIRALRDAGVQQPGVHDRRDRQDGRRLPRRPGVGDARGARPGAERRRSATTTSTSPFDLSRVMFITTANTLDTIPAPLRDRMEVIQLAGYTEEEKLQIAKRYLVPRQIERNGLKKSQIALHRHRAEGDHQRLHARGGRAQPRARDRLGLPQGRAPGRGGHARAARCR